ncbi:MAG: serpin family protein [Deltaproteobacteria bacterium]|nr:serpin family protein [Deltaproteobacteria bacterium]
MRTPELLISAPTLICLLAVAACEPEPARDPRLVTERTTEIATVADANNDFALDLFGEMRAEEGNLFFSPFSISSALSMTYAGAAGTTADEMAEVLHVGLDDDLWHANFGDLTRDLAGDHPGRGYQLSVGNRLWGQDGYPWLQSFVDVNAVHYDAPLEDLDFAADPESARVTINDWVEDQTKGKIEDLLQPGVITSDTRLVLTNAIYFKADWASQFDEGDTYDGAFTLADGLQVITPLMNQELEFQAGAFDGVSVAKLPYQDDEVSMVLLLPDAHDGLPALEEGLTAAQIDGWIADLETAEMLLILPKFEMTYDLSLSETLRDLGMTSAFEPLSADFSGMADLVEGSLFISDVVHKAYVKVDEEGTEAAAATGVVVGVTSAPIGFQADHPFLFLIRDDLTGSILFMGRVADPS